MTRPTDPLFDERIADWLKGDQRHAPDQVLEIVLAAVPSIPQRHAPRMPWSFRAMPMLSRLAAAALIGLLVVGGAFYLGHRGQPSVGSPSSSPPLQSSPTPAPQPSQAAEVTVPAGATTTLLADGRLLIAGGYVYQDVLVDGSIGKYTFLDSAGLYDPATRTFTPTGSMTTARGWHTATLLSDSRVLITGGEDTGGHDLASAELYDPATGTFSPTGSMTDPPGGNPGVRLLDGRVLIARWSPQSSPRRLAELYDPATGTFRLTGPMAFGCFFGPAFPGGCETATLLTDGRVLFAGGPVAMGVCRASAEIFDPTTNTFSPTGSMTAPRCGTATLLQDGRVLMTAGVEWPSSSGRTNQSSAEIFDPRTGTFSPTGSPAHGGTGQTATLLADGRVLVAGGEDTGGSLPLASAELYDPATGTFIPTGSMAVAREVHTATLLSDGRVLVTGGSSHIYFEGGDVTAAEIYDPATGTFSPAK